MSDIIEDRTRRNEPLINALFVPRKDLGSGDPAPGEQMVPSSAALYEGSIQTLKEGYGFIASSDPAHRSQTFFFFHAEVLNADFNDLKPGDRVRFQLGTNPRGPCAVQVSITQ